MDIDVYLLCLLVSDTEEADSEIKALVEIMRPYVESKKGVKYDKFDATSYRSQVIQAISICAVFIEL